MKIKRSEKAVQKIVCDFLRSAGHLFWRLNNTGVYRNDLKRYIPVYYGMKGVPDIIVMTADRTIAIEIKSTIGKLSEDQKLFRGIWAIPSSKREYVVARGIGDLIDVGL